MENETVFETYKDKPELSTLLRENTWSNNMHIVSKTKSYEEKEFYLKLASKEKYKASVNCRYGGGIEKIVWKLKIIVFI